MQSGFPRLRDRYRDPARRPGRRLFPRVAAGAALALLWPGGATAAGEEPVAGAGEQVPKWEAGIGAGWAWTPHYPAAGQNGSTVLALPYFIYRWERVKIGEGGLVSGRVFEDPRVELTASIGGALPAKSEDNRAREGMPDLDTLAEVGAQLDVTLAEREGRDKWKLQMPLRAVVSTDFGSLDYRGVVVRPRVAYSREGLAGGAVEATLAAGPIFASDLLMDYFYDVPPQFATPTRPAYEARGGYMGSAATLYATYDVNERLRLILGGQAAWYGGATNADSPLFRDSTSYSVGLGLVWRILESEETVRR